MAFTVAMVTGLSLAPGPMIRYFAALSTIIAGQKGEILLSDANRCSVLIDMLLRIEGPTFICLPTLCSPFLKSSLGDEGL